MQNIEPRFLCIIGTARTGTDYLCALLGLISGVRSKTEIFHVTGALSLTPGEVTAIGAAADRTFRGFDDPELRDWMRRHPAETVRAIHAAPDAPLDPVLSFKVFPGQLPARMVAERFVPMPDMRFLIVRRRIIDAYISNEKARLLRRWGFVDTTDTRVVLSPAHFVRYVEFNRGWYETLSAEIARAGNPYSKLIYEEFAGLGEEAQLQLLLGGLQEMGFGGLGPAEPATWQLPWKQDRSQSYEHKVVNWREFLDDPLVRAVNVDIFGYF